MKRADFGIIGFALLSLATAMVLNGCNEDDLTRPGAETGDSIKITEQVILQCEEPFTFHVKSDHDTLVTVKTNEEEDIVHAGSFGVDIKYIVLSECNNTCPDTNETVEPVTPVDGECPSGYVLDDCNANNCLPVICDEGSTLNEGGECKKDLTCGIGLIVDDNNTCVIPVSGCDVGTEYNPASGLCEVIPPLECGLGLVDIEGTCIAKVYKLEDDECVNGYTEGEKGYFCFLDNNK